jgi:AcrR family transcriptional regulator
MTEQTKAKLVAAASRLFATRSYENTSVTDISAAAGVTKGAFYHHYTSKEDLLLYIQETALDQVISSSEAVFAMQLPAAEELTKLIRIQLEVIAEHRDALVTTVSERRSLEPEKWSLIRSKRDLIESMMVGCILRGRKSAQFSRNGDPKMLAYGILGMCYWSIVWFRPDRGGWSIEEIAAQFAALALVGLREDAPMKVS